MLLLSGGVHGFTDGHEIVPVDAIRHKGGYMMEEQKAPDIEAFVQVGTGVI